MSNRFLLKLHFVRVVCLIIKSYSLRAPAKGSTKIYLILNIEQHFKGVDLCKKTTIKKKELIKRHFAR